MTLSELVGFLKSRKIPHEEWGTGESKTLAHLLAEINSGEAQLFPEQFRPEGYIEAQTDKTSYFVWR